MDVNMHLIYLCVCVCGKCFTKVEKITTAGESLNTKHIPKVEFNYVWTITNKINHKGQKRKMLKLQI